jgi:hypothetical protein
LAAAPRHPPGTGERLDPRPQVLVLQRHLPGRGGQLGAGLDEVAAQLVAALPGQATGQAGHQKVLYRTEGRRGSANLTVLSRIPRGTLGIVVLCNGPGSIVVQLGSIVSFPVGCDAGPGVYNEIALGSVKKSVAVSVTGSTSNEWALAMGWTLVIDNPAG